MSGINKLFFDWGRQLKSAVEKVYLCLTRWRLHDLDLYCGEESRNCFSFKAEKGRGVTRQ